MIITIHKDSMACNLVWNDKRQCPQELELGTLSAYSSISTRDDMAVSIAHELGHAKMATVGITPWTKGMRYDGLPGRFLHELFAWWYAAGVCPNRRFSFLANRYFNSYLSTYGYPKFRLSRKFLLQDWVVCKEAFLKGINY